MLAAPGRAGAVRALVLAAIVTSLAGPTVRLPAPGETVVFLVDRSRSVDPEAVAGALDDVARRHRALRTGDLAALVLFDARPELVTAPGAPLVVPDLAPPRDGTDLGAALRLARALVPPGEPGRIVLYTDGRDTSGEATSALEGASLAVEVNPLPTAPRARGPFSVVPDRREIAPGETLSGTVVLDGGTEGLDALLRLTLDGRELLADPVRLDPGGRAEHRFAVPLPDDLVPSTQVLEARTGAAATRTDLVIRRPPRIWLVHRDRRSIEAIAASLRADGLDVVALRAPELARRDLSEPDLVVVVDVPTGGSEGLREEIVLDLREQVESGTGLVVVGGEQGYELGGWNESPLASLLPVRTEPEGRVREPAAALVLILDKSGSMAESASGDADLMAQVMRRLVGGNPEGSKIRLVAEAASAALRVLRPTDRVGVLAVDSEPQWAVTLRPVAGTYEIAAVLRGLEAGGGGLAILPALEAAWDALRSERAPLRHVVVFADASDTEGRSEVRDGRRRTALEVVAAMSAEGIHVTVVGVGEAHHRDVGYLRHLAESGGGRLRLAGSFEELRALFVAETEHLVHRSLEEAGTRVLRVGWHPAVRGVDLAAAPPLRGHHVVLPRPRATTVLATPDGDPVLSAWRVGLGEVVAVTTDGGARWASTWTRWEGFQRLWVQLARHAARPTDPAASGITLAHGPEGTRARVTRRDAEGLTRPGPAPSGQVTRNGGETTPLPLTEVEPGLWEGPLPVPPGEAVQVRVWDAPGVLLAERALVTPPSPEDLHDGPDHDLLARLARTEATGRRVRAVRLGPWLLFAVIVALPLDAWLRRGVRS